MKTWKKRLPALLLALVMCLTLLPGVALADDIFVGKMYGEGAYLRNCNDSISTDITIPNTLIVEHYDGISEKVELPVTGIMGHAFRRNTNLKTLRIPGSVVYINLYAFRGMGEDFLTNLTSIYYGGTCDAWEAALVIDNGPYRATDGLPNVTVYCTDGTIGSGNNITATDPGTTTNPGAQSGALTIRRGPDSDSVDLSGMDYPAQFYCYPTLVVDGVEVPESSYHITYSWSLIGLGARPMNNSTSDQYNCSEVYCPYSTNSNLRLTCRAVAEYNGASYTADVAWNNICRSSDYNGSGSSTNNDQVVVTFDSRGGTPVDSITVTTGQTYGPLPTTTRPGYEFWCWETQSNVSIFPNSTVPPSSNGKMTLYARWNKLKEDAGTTTNPGTTTPTNPGTQETEANLAQTAAASFSDVSMGDFFDVSVGWALENQITNGTSDTQFSPYEQCTQAQILTFLYRAARTGGTAAAEDMSHAVNWARDMGVIDGSFDENTPCTRATAVTYIWKAFGQPSMGSSSFTDVPADSAGAVSWAVAKGVTNGTSTITFSPDKVCDRGEIVTFLYRAYH